MKENTNLIYMHWNQISGKAYIGLTIRTMMERWSQHVYDAFKTNEDGSFKSNVKFYRAIRKYGVDTWFHVELYSGTGSNMSLHELEVYYIEKHNTYHNGYNSTLGGEGTSGVDSEAYRKGMITNRKESVKGYYWNAEHQSYQVVLGYLGNKLSFGYFKLESDAKIRADYLMSLSDEELLKAHKEYRANKKSRTKGYAFNKNTGKYQVQFKVAGQLQYFCSCDTEQQAKDKVAEIRKELGII